MYTFSAIEDMQYFQKYQFNLDIDYIQVAKGSYRGEILSYISKDEKSAAIKESNNVEVVINGVPFTDNYLIGFIPRQVKPFYYSANEIKSDEWGVFFIFPPNQELTVQLGADSKTFQYVISEEKFKRMYKKLFHEEPNIKSAVGISEKLSPEIFKKLEACFNSIYKVDMSDVEFWMNELEYYIYLLLEKYQESLTCSLGLHIHSKASDLNKLQEILNFIQSNIKLPIDYPMLCTEFFITRKTLERLFKREIGITPFKYIYFYRLKCINNILMTSYNEQLSLQELALSYNIHHYGRFALSYKAMFGESPKKTLLKKMNILHRGLVSY